MELALSYLYSDGLILKYAKIHLIEVLDAIYFKRGINVKRSMFFVFAVLLSVLLVITPTRKASAEPPIAGVPWIELTATSESSVWAPAGSGNKNRQGSTRDNTRSSRQNRLMALENCRNELELEYRLFKSKCLICIF